MNLFNSTNTSNYKKGCSHFPTDSNMNAIDLLVVLINAITCPFTIFLNMLVIVAVKTKQQLNTNYNTVLACLATTDFLVGLTVQPLYMAVTFGVKLAAISTLICDLKYVLATFLAFLSTSSLYHLVLVSGERYFAINRPYSCYTTVNKPRLIIMAASICAWALASLQLVAINLDHDEDFYYVILMFGSFFRITSILLIVYCHVAVYFEVQRHRKQIVQQQVSVEAKEKMRKERKALKTTTFIIGALIACYTPLATVFLLKTFDHVTKSINYTLLSLVRISVILNSFLNPLIYTTRNREFRVAFIQMLTRKTIQQAQEIEMRCFGSSNVVTALKTRQERKEQDQIGEQGNFEITKRY